MLQYLTMGMIILGCGISGITMAEHPADTSPVAQNRLPKHSLPSPDLTVTNRPLASGFLPAKGEWSFERLSVKPMPKRPDMQIRIVGGSPVDAGKRTYQASLQSPAG